MVEHFEWITPLEALRRLGDWKLIADAIPLRLQAGALQARADVFLINGSAGDPLVPASFWRLYNLGGTWRTGDFMGGGNPTARDPSVFRAIGVKFRADQINTLAIELRTTLAELRAIAPAASEQVDDAFRPPLPPDLANSRTAPDDLETIYDMARRVRDREAATLHEAAEQLADSHSDELRRRNRPVPDRTSMVTRLDKTAKRLFASKTGLPYGSGGAQH
jgi:hypothetical protein